MGEKEEKLYKAYNLCERMCYSYKYPEVIDKVLILLEKLKISYEKKEQEYVVEETNNG